MKISVVIPVINEADRIQESIMRALQAGADEVVVVDGGSSDATVELAKELASDLPEDSQFVLVESSSGRAIQMNRGASVATGDVLLFLHADNWLVENACEQVRDSFRTTNRQFGGFRQKILSERTAFRWIESGNEVRLTRLGLIYGDQAMFVSRELFERLGGFPEIELMEDFELSRSLKAIGKPAMLAGPTFVSARRWERLGLVRQTLLNWCLTFAYRLGASPAWIARQYRRHDR